MSVINRPDSEIKSKLNGEIPLQKHSDRVDAAELRLFQAQTNVRQRITPQALDELGRAYTSMVDSYTGRVGE